MQTFTDYLFNQYQEEVRPLDDDIADGFGEWYSNKDIEEIIVYAEIWKLEIDIKRTEEERDEIKKELSNLNK